jgi:hypothetical protein
MRLEFIFSGHSGFLSCIAMSQIEHKTFVIIARLDSWFTE